MFKKDKKKDYIRLSNKKKISVRDKKRFFDFIKKKDKVKKKSESFNKFQESYKRFSYKLLGKYFDKTEKNEKLVDKLRRANVNMTPGVYVSTIIFTGTLVTIISLFIFTIIFNLLIHSPNWLLYVLFLTALTGIISYIFLPFVVSSRISSRKTQLDHELPFILSELSILASTGLTPIKMMRRMTDRDFNPATKNEFKKIVYKIDVEGKDIITAMSESAKESPSQLFRETLWDITNMIHQGGNLDVYLRNKADTTMELKREIQKEFIEKLGSYSEIYISLVLIGVIMLGIATFLMDVMSAEFGGLNADAILLLLAYLFIPLVIIVIDIIISLAYSKTG